MALDVGMLLYPGLTQLDLTGPHEVFCRLPDARVHLVWKDLAPVRADSGLTMLPTVTLADCPRLDLLFVPGGPTNGGLYADDAVLSFLVAQAERARYVTAVCTGSLVLGAAGLLRGYDATTHWAYTDFLPAFGARAVRKRVVIDRNRITAGGVTAGIDFGLRVAAEVAGVPVAKGIQLMLEYDPEPPFRGHPDTVEPEVLASVQARFAGRRAKVQEQIARWTAESRYAPGSERT